MQGHPHPHSNLTQSFCKWGLLAFYSPLRVLESWVSGSRILLTLNSWRSSLTGGFWKTTKGFDEFGAPILNGNHIELLTLSARHRLNQLFALVYLEYPLLFFRAPTADRWHLIFASYSVSLICTGMNAMGTGDRLAILSHGTDLHLTNLYLPQIDSELKTQLSPSCVPNISYAIPIPSPDQKPGAWLLNHIWPIWWGLKENFMDQ